MRWPGVHKLFSIYSACVYMVSFIPSKVFPCDKIWIQCNPDQDIDVESIISNHKLIKMVLLVCFKWLFVLLRVLSLFEKVLVWNLVETLLYEFTGNV